MAFRRRFVVRLAARTMLLLVAVALTGGLAVWGKAPTLMLLAGMLAIVAGAMIWTLVGESNAELARFVAALERGDLSQAFERGGRGAGFDQLGGAYERALSRLRQERTRGAGAARFAEELIDGVPVALLVVEDEQVAFVNKAARRLFGRSAPCPTSALAGVGEGFVAALREATPGRTRLAHLALDGFSQRVSLDTTIVHLTGAVRRIVAVKVIQAQLDEAELTAQIDLVRVLTHEIMNSLTPVTSLAATASRLVHALDDRAAPGIGDAQLALAALERRATELERFVETYKGFSDTPALDRTSVGIGEWLDRVALLFAATPLAGRVAIAVTLGDGLPTVSIDVGLMTQVLLNLVKNGAEAAADGADPRLSISAEAVDGDRVRIAVVDTGPGIPAPLAREVFLPFFTTKRTGTGIGLSFARQIVLLHGGQIAVVPGDHGCVEIMLQAATRAG